MRYIYQKWKINSYFESAYKGIILFQFISDVSQFIHEIIEAHMHMLKIYVPCIISHGFFILLEVIAFQSNGKLLMVNFSCFSYFWVHDLVFIWIKAQTLRPVFSSTSFRDIYKTCLYDLVIKIPKGKNPKKLRLIHKNFTRISLVKLRFFYLSFFPNWLLLFKNPFFLCPEFLVLDLFFV